MPSRPPVQTAGPFRARPIRGPRADGCWYWRIERYSAGAAETAGTLWGTPAQALARCAELVLGVQPPAGPDGGLTVLVLLRRWVATQEDRADLRPATVDACRQTARRIKASSLASVLVERVTRQTLEAWRDQQLRAGRASRTLQLDLQKLGQAWRWAREVGMVERELPAVRVRVQPSREDYTPTVGEVSAVVQALRQRAADCRARVEELEGRAALPYKLASGRKVKGAATLTARAAAMEAHALALEVLAATGMRRGELVSLRAEHLTRRGQALQLEVRGKTGRRVVPLLGPLVARLEAHAVTCPGLWSESDLNALEKLLFRLQGELSQPHWSQQALRRLAVDRLYSSGAEPGTAAAILGHSPVVALGHYRRARGEDIDAAVLAAGLGELPAGEVIAFRPAQGTRTGR